jgi:hypothetical protein
VGLSRSMKLTLGAGTVDVDTGFDGAATKSAKSSSATTKTSQYQKRGKKKEERKKPSVDAP